MKKGYMLNAGQLYIKPENEQDLWEAKWDIFRKEDNVCIGWVSYEGQKENGRVPISIEILSQYRYKGYGKIVIGVMSDWALLHAKVYEVVAETDKENDAYVFALEKNGFVFRRLNDEKKEIYSKSKQKSAWLGLYIFIGLCIGLALGLFIDNPWAGTSIGLVLGIAVGSSMDAREMKKRKHILGE